MTLPDGRSWPVCQQVSSDIRDQQWATWTSPLGFPVMGIWQSGMDGTDINACDRNPLLHEKSLHELFEETPAGEECHLPGVGRVIVSANDDGTIGLFQYPAVLDRAPHHSFRGHASHVVNVRFTADAKRVISAGGADRTTFQWLTRGIRHPHNKFASWKAGLEGKRSRAEQKQMNAARLLAQVCTPATHPRTPRMND